jgi:peptidoglycan/LPS O-acetylase OafA/YrhL
VTILNINDAVNRHSNNFDLLRFTAAVFVLLGHSYHLLNLPLEEPLTKISGHLFFGELGVDIFFVISGYLVLSSWDRNSNLGKFLKNRVLRIFPALIVVVFLTAFVLGPLVTTLSMKEYFFNPATWRYLESMTIYHIYFTLPGVFEQNIFKDVVNGSLWTLPIEFSLYMILLILGIIGAYKKRVAIVFSSVVLFILYIYHQPTLSEITIPFVGDGVRITRLALFFIAGMIYFLYRERIVFDWRLLLIFFIVWVASFNSGYLQIFSFICIPYFVMFFAFIPHNVLNSFGKFGDFSYGIYIIAFPVQQTIIWLFHNSIQPLPLFALSLGTTLPLAVLSWYVIEKPFLKLKTRKIFPGKI